MLLLDLDLIHCPRIQLVHLDITLEEETTFVLNLELEDLLFVPGSASFMTLDKHLSSLDFCKTR